MKGNVAALFLKLLSSCPGELLLKSLKFFENYFFWCSFSYFVPKLIKLSAKILAEMLRQHSSCPNGNFEVKIFRSKKKLFINIVKNWAKKCQLLAKNVRHGCHSWILRVEENFFWKMKGFEKIILLIFFSGLWVKTFRAVGEKI